MSKSLFKKYRIDRKAELEGVAVKIEDATFWLSRVLYARNPKWALAIDEANKFYADTPESERFDKALRRAFVRGGLTKWEGVTNLEGEELPFSIENAEWLFTECPELLDDLFAQASNRALYLAKQEEDDVKNLSQSSSAEKKKKLGS